MIKIEDTYQEKENPPKTMATSLEDPMVQKILKTLDEYGEPLKKIGGHLTRLEESRLWKYTMMKRKWRNGMKRTKRNIKGTSNFRSLSQKP